MHLILETWNLFGSIGYNWNDMQKISELNKINWLTLCKSKILINYQCNDDIPHYKQFNSIQEMSSLIVIMGFK